MNDRFVYAECIGEDDDEPLPYDGEEAPALPIIAKPMAPSLPATELVYVPLEEAELRPDGTPYGSLVTLQPARDEPAEDGSGSSTLPNPPPVQPPPRSDRPTLTGSSAPAFSASPSIQSPTSKSKRGGASRVLSQAADLDADMRGYLFKKKVLQLGISGWKKRFCVIRKGVFYYYTSDSSAVPKGEVDLSLCSVLRPVELATEKYPYICLSSDRACYYLGLPLLADLEKWYAVISNVATPLSTAPSAVPAAGLSTPSSSSSIGGAAKKPGGAAVLFQSGPLQLDPSILSEPAAEPGRTLSKSNSTGNVRQLVSRNGPSEMSPTTAPPDAPSLSSLSEVIEALQQQEERLASRLAPVEAMPEAFEGLCSYVAPLLESSRSNRLILTSILPSSSANQISGLLLLFKKVDVYASWIDDVVSTESTRDSLAKRSASDADAVARWEAAALPAAVVRSVVLAWFKEQSLILRSLHRLISDRFPSYHDRVELILASWDSSILSKLPS